MDIICVRVCQKSLHQASFARALKAGYPYQKFKASDLTVILTCKDKEDANHFVQ